jgi:opacity protein-like surface antigen
MHPSRCHEWTRFELVQTSPPRKSSIGNMAEPMLIAIWNGSCYAFVLKAGIERLQSTLNSSRIGVATCTVTSPNCGLIRLDTTNTGFAAGAGAQLKFGSLAVRAEYERFSATGRNPSLLSLGLLWSFL